MRWPWRRDTATPPPPGFHNATKHVPSEGPSKGIVLGHRGSAVVDQLAGTRPDALLLETPVGDSDRHQFLAVHGPLDFIIDAGPSAGRAHRFNQTFFHLKAGGRYVILDGAVEVGPTPGPLGELLASAHSSGNAPLRTRRHRLATSRLRALRHHVRAVVDGNDLVVAHDLDDVYVKIRETDLNALLPDLPGHHDLLEVIPADAPPLPAVFEVPRSRRTVDLPIHEIELSLRSYRNVVVGPRQMVLSGRVVLPDSYRHPFSQLTQSHGLVDLARDFAVPATPLPTDVPRLSGTYLHLDNDARGHFGHLVTESISRTWAWPHALAEDPDARVLVCSTPKRPKLLGYELDLYEASGIPRDRVTLIDRPARVDRLISGTPMFSNPQFVHARIDQTWDLVGDNLVAMRATAAPDSPWPRRIFVARRETKRACIDADEVEELFSRRGFEIVHPEDLPLGDQVEMFRAADVVAGFAGSGMFHLAFVKEPKRVILIVSEAYDPRNELLIAAVRRHRIDSIVCEALTTGVKGTRTDFRFNMQRSEPMVTDLLDSMEA